MTSKAPSLTTLALLPAVAIILTSCSNPKPPPPDQAASQVGYQAGVPGGVIVNTLEVSARVTDIDQTIRKATLLGSDGKKFTVKVGPEAVNFDQVKVGDLVKATLTEELVVYLGDEASAARDTAAGLVALAPKGAQPGGLVAGAARITGTVLAIDRKRRTATLRFEDGSTETFPVRSDVDLTKRDIGEKVVFRVTEMIALKIEKP